MDDRIDDILDSAARDYHEPPAPPRDAMWQRIEAARKAEHTAIAVVPIRRRIFGRELAWSAGIAAVLAVGIGIGRTLEHATVTTPSNAAPTVASGTGEPHAAAPSRDSLTRPSPRAGSRDVPAINASTRNANASAAAFGAVLTQHLGQSEAFLTLFRSSVRSGRTERLASATARQLLSTNRLLLDSRAGRDLRSRQLLQDLELVLAQIAQLRTDGDSTDVRLITEGIDEGDVLPRLRIIVPAGI